MSMSDEPTLLEKPLPAGQEEQRDLFSKPGPSAGDDDVRWHSRGYLPRFDPSNSVQFITIRLGDALPSTLLLKWRCELAHLPAGTRELELRTRAEDHLDVGQGACWLRRPEIAQLVENAFMAFDASRCHLLAWCVMPNHAHVLVETLPDWEVGQLAQAWKSETGNEASKLLGRRGGFWQGEHFDRTVGDGFYLESLVQYVEDNPVKAGLVSTSEAWPFSSARFRRRTNSEALTESK